MDIAAVSSSQLDRAMWALRQAGRTIRPVPERLGYFFVDDYVKDAEAIIEEAGVATKH